MYLQSLTTKNGITYTVGEKNKSRTVAYIYQHENSTNVVYANVFDFDIIINTEIAEQR